MAANRGRLRHADLWGFFLFCHGWTWLFWGIALLRGVDVWSSPLSLSLLALGASGVPLAGFVMTYQTQGRAALRELGLRIVDPRRISAGCWATVLLLYPAAKLVAGGVKALLGTSEQALDLHGAAARLADPGRFLLFAGFILLAGPLLEEIGWRGYLLDRLQERWTALSASASLLLGAVWFARVVLSKALPPPPTPVNLPACAAGGSKDRPPQRRGRPGQRDPAACGSWASTPRNGR